MKPSVCRDDLKITIPIDTEECEFWLEVVNTTDDVKSPSRDHAYLDNNCILWLWNGKRFISVNDPATLQVTWGNIIGNLIDQTDLNNELVSFIKDVYLNGNKLEHGAEQEVQINAVEDIKVNGETVEKEDGVVNIDLSDYALADSVPTMTSELINDSGFVTQEEMIDERANANWDENNANSPAYVENRTHYTETESIPIFELAESTIGEGLTETVTDGTVLSYFDGVEEGDRFVVTVGENEYPCTVVSVTDTDITANSLETVDGTTPTITVSIQKGTDSGTVTIQTNSEEVSTQEGVSLDYNQEATHHLSPKYLPVITGTEDPTSYIGQDGWLYLKIGG